MNDPDHVVRANPHVVPSAVRNTGGTEVKPPIGDMEPGAHTALILRSHCTRSAHNLHRQGATRSL